MDTIPFHPLIEVSQDQMKQTREFYGLGNSQRIKESLDVVEEWCKKQDHLVDALPFLSRVMLERIFVLAKGSIEGTKTKVDKLLTTRGMMADICLNKSVEEFETLCSSVTKKSYDLKHKKNYKLSKCDADYGEKEWGFAYPIISHFEPELLGSYIPLPKLNPSDNSRVMVTQLAPDNIDQLSLLSYLRYCYLIGEYRLNFDYSIAERHIVDLKYAKTSLLAKLNLIVLKKAESLCTEGFGTKINGIHLLNAPPFVDKFVFILKQGLKEKVANRLYVHNSYDDLEKHISREILPKDYNGDGPSISKLTEQWKETLKSEETRKLIHNAEKLVSNESKRSTCKFNEEYLGMPGSFRKLNVD